jgi:hypothetical protein
MHLRENFRKHLSKAVWVLAWLLRVAHKPKLFELSGQEFNLCNAN